MKFKINILFILIINIYFIGCNIKEDNLTSIEGRAVANGYLQNSTVCLDIDNDNICSKNEPRTTTNSDGSFNLDVHNFKSTNIKKSSILVYGGLDKRTKEKFSGKFKISADNKNIVLTPLNTIIYFMNKDVDSNNNKKLKYDIKLLIQAIFIISNIDISEDPLKLKNIDSILFKVTLILHKVIENLISDTVKNKNDYMLSIYKKIGKLILEDEKIDFREIIKEIINDDKNISLAKRNQTNIILNKIEDFDYKNDKLIGLKIDYIIRNLNNIENNSSSFNIDSDKSIIELRAETIFNLVKSNIKNIDKNSVKSLIIKRLKESKINNNDLSLQDEIKLFMSNKETIEIGKILQKVFNDIDFNILNNNNEDVKLSTLYFIDDDIFLNKTTSRISIEENSSLKIEKILLNKSFNIKISKNKKSKLFLIDGKWLDSNNTLNYKFNKNILKTKIFNFDMKYIFNLNSYKNNKELHPNFKNIDFNSKAQAYLIQKNINSLYFMQSNSIENLNNSKFNSLLSFLKESYITTKNSKYIYINRKFKNNIPINNSPLIDIHGEVIKVLKNGLKGELVTIKNPLLKKYNNLKIIGYWNIFKLENSDILALSLSINDEIYILHNNKIHKVQKNKKDLTLKLFLNQNAFDDLVNNIKTE